jgi:hypothetical protein
VNDETATVETTEDGTDTITDEATVDGTFDQDTMTTPVSDGIVITYVHDKLDTDDAGTNTGDDHVDGIVTTDGINVNDETAIVETTEDGIPTITDEATLDGTFDHETMTTPVSDGIVITYVQANPVTDDAGTNTGVDHVDGTVTADGINVNDETATVETTEDGTDTITDEATLDGTFDQDTITTPVSDGMIITYVHGKLETDDAGTKTGDDQVDGTVTTDGTHVNDETATVETIELGISITSELGTELGTLEYEITANDGDDGTMTI